MLSWHALPKLTAKKLRSAFKALGFEDAIEVAIGADLCTIEEANDFMNEVPEKLPFMATSCCPAWVDFMEKFYPDMIPHFSTCKSPHEIVGSLTKTYYATKMGIDPEKIKVVSIMPCTAKKFEILRSEEMFASGFQDVDVSLTTREVARMIKQCGIDFANLPDEEADSPLGQYTGAATVFGFTGGVMEAALRTVHALVTGREMNDEDLEIKPILGIGKGIKEMALNLDGREVRIAVAHGTGNVEEVLTRVKEALAKGEEPPYHFIEVMACDGGCVGGGGQPLGVTDEIRQKRINGLMTDDEKANFRRSHQNPDIKKLYDEFLEKPLSTRAHHLLHTTYKPRPLYKR